jgi:hypothetical protein
MRVAHNFGMGWMRPAHDATMHTTHETYPGRTGEGVAIHHLYWGFSFLRGR